MVAEWLGDVNSYIAGNTNIVRFLYHMLIHLPSIKAVTVMTTSARGLIFRPLMFIVGNLAEDL